jgi:hypothetical protein
LDYSAPTVPGTADLQTLIGDGYDMIKTVNPSFDNLATCVANNLKVSGTYGSKTIEILRNLSVNQVRFHVLQGEASAASYWSNKAFAVRLLASNAQGSASGVNMDFNLNQDGSQFNDKIRQIPNFRFTISGYTAMQIAVNEGEQVTFTFKFRSSGAAQIMELARV